MTRERPLMTSYNFRWISTYLPIMSDEFYLITSDFWGSFWTYLHNLKSDVINGGSPTNFVSWAILFGNIILKYILKYNSGQKGPPIFFFQIKGCNFKHFNVYRKIASSNTFRLEAHVGFFRLFMKRIFGPYVLWPFDKKLIF